MKIDILRPTDGVTSYDKRVVHSFDAPDYAYAKRAIDSYATKIARDSYFSVYLNARYIGHVDSRGFSEASITITPQIMREILGRA